MILPKLALLPKLLRTIHIIAAIDLVVAAAANYYVDGSAVMGMITTFIAGLNAAAALSTNQMIRAREAFDQMHAAFDAMVEMNQQLIAGKVQFIMEGREDEAPTAPRLH